MSEQIDIIISKYIEELTHNGITEYSFYNDVLYPYTDKLSERNYTLVCFIAEAVKVRVLCRNPGLLYYMMEDIKERYTDIAESFSPLQNALCQLSELVKGV